RLVQVRAEQRRGAFVVGADRNRAAQGLHRGAEPAGLAPQERELHRARLVSPPARVWGARARTASPPVSPGSGRGGTVLMIGRLRRADRDGHAAALSPG